MAGSEQVVAPTQNGGGLAAGPGEKLCSECWRPIPGRASKCPECGSHLGRTRFVFFASSALGAVLGVVGPLWAASLSLWTLAFAGEPDIQLGQCTNDRVMIYMRNSGRDTAILRPPVLEVTAGQETRPLALVSPVEGVSPVEEDDLLLDPGEVDLVEVSGWPFGAISPEESRQANCAIKVRALILGGEEKLMEASCSCPSVS